MNRRVLIVSPHFPPVNAPDMQRARQALPHLATYGWEAEVLAVDPGGVEAPQDSLLEATLPADVPIHRVQVLSPRLGRWLGRRTLAPRALAPLRRRGDELLRAGRFDLVFFTTTQFGVMQLGPRWRARFGVPYVLDWQDPWVTDYYSRPGAPPPPGGWRYWISHAQARRLEGPCLLAASGWVGTSEVYRTDLEVRYAGFRALPQAVIPFGFEPTDFAAAQRLGVSPALSPAPGTRNLVFVGAAGAIMEPALQTLFSALAGHALGEATSPLRLHFLGTSYAPADRAVPTVEPVARRHGLAHLVHESPPRIGYFAALRTLQSADALLLLGSKDTGYNPSKIASLLYAEKPVLAIVSSAALAAELATHPQITVILVGSPAAPAQVQAFCADFGSAKSGGTDQRAAHSAARRTQELAQLFDRAHRHFHPRES